METTFSGVVTDFTAPKFVEDLKTRDLAEGELLVKIHSVTVNPSDTYFAKGVYGNPTGAETLGIGFEGSGEVVQVGPGVEESLVGKRVAASNFPGTQNYEGSWRQYLHVHKNRVMVYPDDADFDKIAPSFVNPITVALFWKKIQETGAKAVVHTGAASSLGKMFYRLCKDKDIQILNIVRKEEQVKALQDLGAEYVLNSTTETYQADLEEAIAKIKPSAFFDCVGGELTQNILFKMPRFSTLYIYGSLDPDGKLTFGNRELMGQRKTITALFATDLLEDQKELDEAHEFISKDIYDGGKIFGTEIPETFPLSEYQKAIEKRAGSATDGKYILKPWE